jgi:hypothetical protein
VNGTYTLAVPSDPGITVPGYWTVTRKGAGRGRKPAVVIVRGQCLPALMSLAGDVGEARLTLGIERVELLLEPIFGRLAGVDRATRASRLCRLRACAIPSHHPTFGLGSAVAALPNRRSGGQTSVFRSRRWQPGSAMCSACRDAQSRRPARGRCASLVACWAFHRVTVCGQRGTVATESGGTDGAVPELIQHLQTRL